MIGMYLRIFSANSLERMVPSVPYDASNSQYIV